MATNKNQKLILYAAGIGAGYFFILKPILVKLGIVQSAAQAQQSAAQTQNVTDYLTIDSSKLTKPLGEWQLIANTIYTDLKDLALADNVNDAIYQLCRVQNDQDVKALIQTFGARQVTALGYHYGGDLMLPDFIKQSLSSSEIDIVNNNYSRKNIQFKF